MTAELHDKVCLVTGASRGIGAAIATLLAERGGKIAVHYGSNEEAAQAVCNSLNGDDHRIFGCDLADAAVAPNLVERVVKAFGRIDVLVNNAGIYIAHPVLKVSGDEWLQAWRQIFEVNLVSPAALCQSAAKAMATKGGGRIVNVGSRGAFRGEPLGPAYGASKAALHSMSQSLAVALAPDNIQVFAVAPGFVQTDMAKPLLESEAGDGIRGQSPLNRVGTPEEIAEAVAFLASTAPEFMIGGVIDINGASYLRM